MEKLRFEIKEIVRKPSSEGTKFLTIGVLIILAILLLPFLLILWIIGALYNLFSSDKKVEYSNPWHPIPTETDLELNYKWTNIEDIRGFINDYFDGRPLIVFENNLDLEFFQGYFTEFRIERNDGLILQKIILNQEENEIQSLPLYFFDYASKKATLIRDLKGYDIDAKGGSDDFIISAIGEENELEIRFTKE